MLKWFKPLLNYHTQILQKKKKKKQTNKQKLNEACDIMT